MGKTIKLNRKHITGMARRYRYKNVSYVVYSSFCERVSSSQSKKKDSEKTLKGVFESALIRDTELTIPRQTDKICSTTAVLSARKES